MAAWVSIFEGSQGGATVPSIYTENVSIESNVSCQRTCSTIGAMSDNGNLSFKKTNASLGIFDEAETTHSSNVLNKFHEVSIYFFLNYVLNLHNCDLSFSETAARLYSV